MSDFGGAHPLPNTANTQAAGESCVSCCTEAEHSSPVGVTHEQYDGIAGAHGSWRSMKQRCSDPDATGYDSYGGRGIRVCAEWSARGGFDSFLAHVGPRPTARHTLDRIDVNGHYEPGNVRWASASQQNSNRRGSHWLTHNGESLPVVEWARRLGVKRNVITGRLKWGWSVEMAVTTPPIRRGMCLPRALRGERDKR